MHLAARGDDASAQLVKNQHLEPATRQQVVNREQNIKKCASVVNISMGKDISI